MSAYLIICGAVGLLALALAWVARNLSTAARARNEELDRLRREADASWAQTLEHLGLGGTQRRMTQRRHALGRLRR